MNDAFRHYLVQKLEDAVASIGVRFERFGQLFSNYVVDTPLLHRGTNELGLPVGHAVDSVSADGLVVIEYGSGASYFTPPFTKPRQDWKHVRTLHPEARRVYLVTSQTLGPKNHTRLVRLATRAKRVADIDVEVFDARRIAETIVDGLIEIDEAVDQLGEFVPLLEELRDEFVATNLVPEAGPEYVPRPALERSILDLLARNRAAGLGGISGLGKTKLAAAAARLAQEESRVGVVVWLDARNIEGIEQLHGAEFDRRGRRVNVFALSKRTSCLIVLDDLRSELDTTALLEKCGPKTWILITRQKLAATDIGPPPLDESESRAVLERDVATRCPDEILRTVTATVRGHPLALRLLNGIVRVDGIWRELVDECAHIAEYEDAERPVRLAERLLERLIKAAPKELSLLFWNDGGDLDPGFARAAIGKGGVAKLRSAGVFVADSEHLLRLHELVVASLSVVKPPAEQYASDFVSALERRVIEITLGQPNRLSLLRLARVHRDLLNRLAAANPDRAAAFLYPLFITWETSNVDVDALGDLLARARSLTESHTEVHDIEVLAVLEAIEAGFLSTRMKEGDDAAQRRLRAHLAVFDVFLASNRLSTDAHDTTLHHYAKALNRIGRLDDALAICSGFFTEGREPHPSTKLLFARLLAKKGGEGELFKASSLLLEILAGAAKAPAGAELTVTLGTIQQLGREKTGNDLKTALENFAPLISEHVVAGATIGLDWAFEALAAIARRWQWMDEESFKTTMEQLPTLADFGKTDTSRATRGRLFLALAGTARGEARLSLLNSSIAAYSGMDRPSDFDVQQLGSALVKVGDFDGAVELLMPRVGKGEDRFIRYWLAAAKLGLNDLVASLRFADGLCDGSEPSDRFFSAFHRLRYFIRKASGDGKALDDLMIAMEACGDERFRKQLEDEVAIALSGGDFDL